jgi:hypothetical protein
MHLTRLVVERESTVSHVEIVARHDNLSLERQSNEMACPKVAD